MTDTHQQAAVDAWNARYPIGTPVTAYPVARPEDDPSAERIATRTRGEAFVFSGTAVVMVDGYERIDLTHVDPVQSADASTVGPRCGNNPHARLTDGDRQAIAEFRAYLARRRAGGPPERDPFGDAT